MYDPMYQYRLCLINRNLQCVNVSQIINNYYLISLTATVDPTFFVIWLQFVWRTTAYWHWYHKGENVSQTFYTAFLRCYYFSHIMWEVFLLKARLALRVLLMLCESSGGSVINALWVEWWECYWCSVSVVAGMLWMFCECSHGTVISALWV